MKHKMSEIFIYQTSHNQTEGEGKLQTFSILL